ncbi:hypothetical protein NSTC745_01152 [Nostoc sp. DSM 114161]|jgi:hypothetical protein
MFAAHSPLAMRYPLFSKQGESCSCVAFFFQFYSGDGNDSLLGGNRQDLVVSVRVMISSTVTREMITYWL